MDSLEKMIREEEKRAKCSQSREDGNIDIVIYKDGCIKVFLNDIERLSDAKNIKIMPNTPATIIIHKCDEFGYVLEEK